MILDRVNSLIAKYLKDGKYRSFRYTLLFRIVAILTLGLVYNSKNEFEKYEYSILYEWLSYFVIIGGVIYFNLKVLVPHFLVKGRLTNYVSSILFCAVVTIIFIIIIQNLLFEGSGGGNLIKPLLNVTGNIISIGLIVVSTSIYALFREWAKQNQQINELITSTVEAELQQLKNQINPHFLFNTINNANIKAENDPEQAFNIISKLRGLLSYQLADSRQDQVLLKDDILFLSGYLELEKTRRGRFSYSLINDERALNLQVYPLLFIPFVENAVKHSWTTRSDSFVNISFQIENGYLKFHCENTKPSTPIQHKSGGLGLKNIKRRLELLYNNKYILNIHESAEKYIVNLYLKI